MPMLQSEWAAKPAAGAVGRRANMEEWNTITRQAEADDIGFGQPVMQGTLDAQTELYDGAGVFIGITEADQTLSNTTGLFPTGYDVPVCESGVIWVMAGEDGCTVKGAVYWDSEDGTYSDNDAGILVPGSEFDSTAAGGEVVKVRLRRQPAAVSGS